MCLLVLWMPRRTAMLVLWIPRRTASCPRSPSLFSGVPFLCSLHKAPLFPSLLCLLPSGLYTLSVCLPVHTSTCLLLLLPQPFTPIPSPNKPFFYSRFVAWCNFSVVHLGSGPPKITPHLRFHDRNVSNFLPLLFYCYTEIS